MKVTYNHFQINNDNCISAWQSDSSEIRNSKSLSNTIDKLSDDTGIESINCKINEKEGYAINKTDRYLTVITIGEYNDHPIAKSIEQFRSIGTMILGLV